MNTDPIVSEVRQARDKLARRHKNNPDKIYQAMKRAEEKENWPKAKLTVERLVHLTGRSLTQYP